MIRNNKIWQKTKLGNIGKIVSGGTPSTDKLKYWNGDIFWITPTEITKLQGKYILNTERKITKLGLEKSSAKLIPAMSLIICSRATVGDCGINKIEITTNQGFKNIIPNKKIDILFLYYFICTKKLQLKRISSGSTFLEFSKFDLEKLNLLLPPLPEQNRIVAVLEVWDGAIEKLGRKIEIKKQIKKGLMQNLLTGKKRLSGFEEKWVTMEFSDCFNVLVKIKGEKKLNYLAEGKFPIIDQSQHKIAGYSNNQEFVINNNFPFIIFGDHTRILKLINFSFVLGNDGTKVFQGKNGCDTSFLFYLLNIIKVPNTGYNRHFKFLKDLILHIPNIKEQAAIVQILTTADWEIESLEKKKRIIEEQKKYLLNNLVTGRIRV